VRKELTFTVAALAVLGLAGSCTLTSSLDDLKKNQPKGNCATNIDCTGCVDCTTKCGCLIVTDFTACVKSCEGNGGSAGVGGTSATGGTFPTGGTGAGGTGGTGGVGGNPSQPGHSWCSSPIPCDLSAQSCCYALNAGTLWPNCIAKTKSCAGVRFDCDGTEDCSAGVCCLALSAGPNGQAQCKAACSTGEVKLCGSDASQCTGSLVCDQDPTVSDFNSCQ
jgi:hypothetical protein